MQVILGESAVQLKRFENAAEYYERVKPFLMTQEAAHCVMLGVCATLIQTDIYQQPPYLAYVEDKGEIVAAAMRTPPYNLLLSYMADESPINIIADDVYKVYGCD